MASDDDEASNQGKAAASSSPKQQVQHNDLHDCVVDQRFQVTGLIGLGGMGAVWQARDLKIDRDVAIKVLPPRLTRETQYRERFLREAQAAARLREHPHIVPVYHCGLDRERESLYLAMRLVRGISLRDRIKEWGPLTEPEGLVVMREVLSALGFAHEHGIVHRDVKPDNILIETATGISRLTDFGLVRFDDPSTIAGSAARLTAVGQVMGTPQWMSPEQCEGQTVDGRSDLYSAGLCFYYMLTGSNPFSAPTTPRVLLNQLQKAAPSLRESVPALSAAIERFVLILLAKPPDRRFPDAAAALAALSQVEKGEVPSRGGRARAAKSAQPPSETAATKPATANGPKARAPRRTPTAAAATRTPKRQNNISRVAQARHKSSASPHRPGPSRGRIAARSRHRQPQTSVPLVAGIGATAVALLALLLALSC